MNEPKSLYQLLLEQGVPAEEMSSHESDLYVLFTEDRLNLVSKHSPFPEGIKVQRSDVKGQDWYGKFFIDIPFGYMPEHAKARGIK